MYSVFDIDGNLVLDTTNMLLAQNTAEQLYGHAYSYETDRFYQTNDQGEWAWRDANLFVLADWDYPI